MTEPAWLNAQHLIDMNRMLLANTSERHFLREPEGIEASLYRVWCKYSYEEERSISQLAAHLILAVCMAHAFEQGNKRTAWSAGRFFLRINGLQLALNEQDQLHYAKMIESMITDETLVDMLAMSIERDAVSV